MPCRVTVSKVWAVSSLNPRPVCPVRLIWTATTACRFPLPSFWRKGNARSSPTSGVLFPLTTITVPDRELLPGRMCERNVPDVSPPGHGWPVAGEHAVAEAIDLNLPNTLPPGPLEA